jgi:hypothetical protein
LREIADRCIGACPADRRAKAVGDINPTERPIGADTGSGHAHGYLVRPDDRPYSRADLDANFHTVQRAGHADRVSRYHPSGLEALRQHGVWGQSALSAGVVD